MFLINVIEYSTILICNPILVLNGRYADCKQTIENTVKSTYVCISIFNIITLFYQTDRKKYLVFLSFFNIPLL